MVCPECGRFYVSGETECTECGRWLPGECRRCRTLMQWEDAVCPECGETAGRFLPDNAMCPRCGSKNTALIIYGLPPYNWYEECPTEQAELGGCCIRDDSPDRRCYECGHQWDDPAGAG